ncbi:MAG: hypothetical protein HKN93_03545, partial [Acidimicrobiia bacterium]|nr:hypothetical protein [Acidimicrobiia bacterium]
MRPLARVLFVLALISVSVVAVPGTASADLYTCDEAGIDQALADGGGPHHFDCGGPTHIPLSATKNVLNDVILEGGHNLILSGQGTHRHFRVGPGVSAEFHQIVFVEGFTTGYGGAIKSGGTLVVGGSEFYGNYADLNGGAIWNDGGLVAVGDTVFEGNLAAGVGAAIASRGGLALVNGAHFAQNNAQVSGGAIGVLAGGLHVAGSHFQENRASFGGAIYGQHDVSITVEHSGFEGNFAGNGGAVAVEELSGVQIFESHFGGNAADANGGAIFVEPDVVLDMQRVHFEGNTAGTHGGAIYVEGARAFVADSEFHGNHADSGAGGGLFVVGSTVVIERSGFGGNTAASSGGAVMHWRSTGQQGGPGLVAESYFAGNSARSGGAIANKGDSGLQIHGSEFHDNAAEGAGGGVHNSGGTSGVPILWVTDSDFSSNSAAWGGAVANTEGGTLLMDGTQVMGNHAAIEGGGLQNFNEATAEVTNSMFADNFAGTAGGGISNGGSVGGSTLIAENVLAVGNHAEVNGGAVFADPWSRVSVLHSAILYNSAGQNGGAAFFAGPNPNQSSIIYSCIEGNTDTAVYDSGLGYFADNWWGAADGPSGPTGTGSGDSLLTDGPYEPFSDVPLGPCLFPQAPWDPGRPSSGMCEVLVWFDEATVLVDTDDEADEWTLTGVARFYDADPMRDRETAVIGIADFTADAGETVVLEQQWRTAMWAGFGGQIRFDDLALLLT